MRHTVSLSLLIAAALAAPVEALAQPDNGHSLGRQVAIELCSSCHRVTEGQPLPPQNVASFFAVRSNHKGMPNLIVSESDSDELIDYILSLKRR